jgi:protein TonB
MAPVRPAPAAPGVRRSLALSALLHGAVLGAAAVGLFAAAPGERTPVDLATAIVVVPALEEEEAPAPLSLPEVRAESRAEEIPELPEILMEEVAASPPSEPRGEERSHGGDTMFFRTGPDSFGNSSGRIAPRSGGKTVATGASAVPAAAAAAVAVEEEYLPPRPLPDACQPPTYPSRARGAAGTVRLRIAVGADGLVEGIAVAASSGHVVLDEAALAAVRTWRFEPAREGGAAVAASVLQPVTFAGRR